MCLELAQFGIDVVIIEPGAIQTEFDDVMHDPMIKRSGQGPYKNLVNALVHASKETDESGGTSDPSVISDLVLKAVRAKIPHTRYVGGKYAKPMMFIRKWFGDRIYDKAVMSMIIK